MLKKQLILSVIAVTVALGLFLLPKSVVDNESENNNKTTTVENTGPGPEAAEHVSELPEEAQKDLAELREAYKNSKNSENFARFANSLIDRFASLNQYDSAAIYAEELTAAEASTGNLQKAGDMYYEAFTYAMDADKSRQMGDKARYYYEQLLAQDPEQLDAKAKMAMTYISSANPMQGIQMLREVLETDASNELAVYNLGLLSMQSGQYDRAVERFKTLAQLNPGHLQAQFLLGVSYFEAGNKAQAKEQFEKVKSMDTDPSVTASVDEYLNQL